MLARVVDSTIQLSTAFQHIPRFSGLSCPLDAQICLTVIIVIAIQPEKLYH